MGDDHVRFLLKLPGKNATLCTSIMYIYACMCECLEPVENHQRGCLQAVHFEPSAKIQDTYEWRYSGFSAELPKRCLIYRYFLFTNWGFVLIIDPSA